MKAARTTPTGIHRVDDGWRAFVRVHGHLKSKRFPLNTPLAHMQRWRELQRVTAHFGLQERSPDTPSFAADAQRYLKLAEGMPSYQDRAYHIHQWVAAFGLRARATITPAEIRSQLEHWRRFGRADGKGLSAGSLNRRRTALMALYTTLDGKRAVNPVKDVPPFDERASALVLRAQPMGTLYRILACLRPSKTRARLRLMIWTGWPHKQIGLLEPRHVDLARQRVFVTGRAKGFGTASLWLPILPGAARALEEFAARQAWGSFSASAVHSAWARAHAANNRHRAELGLDPLPWIRPYDIRHSFGAWFSAHVTDERAIDTFMLSKQWRYRQGSLEARLRAAAHLAAQSYQVTATTGSPGVTRAVRKARRAKKRTRRTRTSRVKSAR